MTGKIGEAVNRDLIGVGGGALRVTTPALMLDLPSLRRNIKVMAEQCAAAGLGLRPHAKTHKSPQLAREQIEAGALGVCCATPHEAIAMARSGVGRILLTSPVVQPRHYCDLAALFREGLDLMVVIDAPSQVENWAAALADAPSLPVLVDIDIGMGRTGVRSPEDAVEVAKAVSATPALSYRGVQGYSGMIQHINDFEERRQTYGRQLDTLDKTLAALTRHNLPPEIISGGGTGSFAIDVERGLYTECQVGSYIFMDVEYNEVAFFRDRPNPYLTSLFLRTTVISANTPGQVTINAGFKSLATDGPLAHVMRPQGPGYSYKLYGDEYGRIVIADGAARPAIGATIDLMTPHCDPTVNLHDWYHVVDGDRLVDIWPIVARGVL